MLFSSLPVEHEFAIYPEIAIYPPTKKLPTLISGRGRISFVFTPTDDADILSVAVTRMRLRLTPFSISLDIDDDGFAECFEVGPLLLDETILDTGTSRGVLNLASGAFEFTFDYVVTARQVPLLESISHEPLTFSIRESGHMDLDSGAYELSFGVFEVEGGPLAGALIRNHGPSEGIVGKSSAPSLIRLSGVVFTPDMPLDCTKIKDEDKQKDVWICEGDEVLLCWQTSRDVNRVLLEPGSQQAPPNSGLVVRPARPASGLSLEYSVKSLGGRSEEVDTFQVNFYSGEWLGPFEAARADGGWRLDIPVERFSRQIVVREIVLWGSGVCFNVPSVRLFLEHIDPPPIREDEHRVSGGRYGDRLEPVDPATGRSRPTPVYFPFPAAGTWRFFPPYEYQEDDRRPVCFMFRGSCEAL